MSLRDYWDADASTYDHAPSHGMHTAAERAAWTAALERLLPPAPARVLDVGAGTGFLSLVAASLGHLVTALDFSAGMLAQLQEKAEHEGVAIEVVTGEARQPPEGPFDAVIERHLVWTLPEPHAALQAWRAVAPAGRLLLVEGLWGGADAGQARRQRAREALRRLRRKAPHHHAPYDPAIRAALPLGRGTHPDMLVELAEATGWRNPALERLHDVEWCRLLALPPLERLLGTTPQYVVSAS